MHPVTQVHILNFPVFGRGLSLRHQHRNLNRLDGLISPPWVVTFIEAGRRKCAKLTRWANFSDFGWGLSLRRRRLVCTRCVGAGFPFLFGGAFIEV